MRQADRALQLSVASVIDAADAALKERSGTSPPRRRAPDDVADSRATTQLDSESVAYIEAYVEADEDVKNETYLPRKLEAMRVARICGVVSDLARKGELPQPLASEFIRECKEQAARMRASVGR